MKGRLFILITMSVLLTSCGSAGHIYSGQDDFNKVSSVKLKQSLKAYSDENPHLLKRPNYTLNTRFVHMKNAQEALSFLDIQLQTRISSFELDPKLYIALDDEIKILEAELEGNKYFQADSIRTTYQLMHLRFNTSQELLNEMSRAGDISFKLYLGYEGIEAPLRSLKRRRFNRFVEKLES